VLSLSRSSREEMLLSLDKAFIISLVDFFSEPPPPSLLTGSLVLDLKRSLISAVSDLMRLEMELWSLMKAFRSLNLCSSFRSRSLSSSTLSVFDSAGFFELFVFVIVDSSDFFLLSISSTFFTRLSAFLMSPVIFLELGEEKLIFLAIRL